MKILHTADVHLREDDSTTIEALEQVLNKAEDENVDLLTIGGDLFDSAGDADSLRPKLRDKLSDNPFDIIAIPGNHDAEVYKENLQFGRDLEVLVDEPFETLEYDGIEIIGVPYSSSLTEELYSGLMDAQSDDKIQILLLHCTLDIGFMSSGFGEGEQEYFPVKKSVLSDLGYNYILAGHIHSTDREIPLESGGKFIYPGSPVSLSTKETGQRKAILIDTSENRITSLTLDSFYYDDLTHTVHPGEEEKAVQQIRQWVSEHEENHCELHVNISGFISTDEREFLEKIREAAGPAEVNDQGIRLVKDVLDHPLYQRFKDRLEEQEEIEDEQAVRERVIKVMSQLLNRREIQA